LLKGGFNFYFFGFFGQKLKNIFSGFDRPFLFKNHFYDFMSPLHTDGG
jgi:hypothetical protein